MEAILQSFLKFRYANSCLCVFSAFVVALSGIVPILFIPATSTDSKGLCTDKLNRWLSYATGSILGEVFLHLLPETWTLDQDQTFIMTNSWLFIGLILFFFIEKLSVHEDETKQVESFFNLFLNAIDNFTHGVAIGGSYLSSTRLGILTTLCILIHEVPHEVGDFVILLRNGFTRGQAAKAQLLTATGCVIGAFLTLTMTTFISGLPTMWILPFTAGGFLYIALVSLLPDLLKVTAPRESVLHLCLISLGFVSMFLISAIFG